MSRPLLDPRLAVEPVASGVESRVHAIPGGLVKPNAALIPEEPFVSCLCVTENRWAFLPWVLWTYDRQEWKRKELVIVDSSEPPLEVPVRDDVRVIRAPNGSTVGAKRNVALDAADGELIAWFDDDDWQHPKRLSWLVTMLCAEIGRLGASYVGPSQSWFVDLWAETCRRYHRPCHAIFNGSVFVKHAVANERFPENVLRSEDTIWLRGIDWSRLGACLVGQPPPVSFWLSHDANTSNRRKRHRTVESMQELKSLIGPDWGETSEQMDALRTRLQSTPSEPPVRVAWIESALRAQARERADRVVEPPQVPEPGPVEPAVPATASVEASAQSSEGVALGSVAPPEPVPRISAPAARANGSASARPSRTAPSSVTFDERCVSRAKVVPRVRAYVSLGRGETLSDEPALTRLVAGLPRWGSADAQIAVARRRRREWKNSAFVGVFDGRVWKATRLSLAVLEEALSKDGPEPDVLALGRRNPESICRWMNGVDVSGEPSVRRVFREYLRLPTRLLTRPIPMMGCEIWLARPGLLERYVAEWLAPAREALAAEGGNVPDRVCTALLAALAPVFFSHIGCRVRILDPAFSSV